MKGSRRARATEAIHAPARIDPENMTHWAQRKPRELKHDHLEEIPRRVAREVQQYMRHRTHRCLVNGGGSGSEDRSECSLTREEEEDPTTALPEKEIWDLDGNRTLYEDDLGGTRAMPRFWSEHPRSIRRRDHQGGVKEQPEQGDVEEL